MPVLFANSIVSAPYLPIVRSPCRTKERHDFCKQSLLGNHGQMRALTAKRGHLRLAVGLRASIQPIVMNRQMQKSSTVCFAALNARCGAEQTQTITREAPTITQAPTHIQEKSPQLDDGGTGFPPRDDGDGGGGGGGGGGNWSGGFFFFAFLAFLGFLKDKENEGDYYDGRRRR